MVCLEQILSFVPFVIPFKGIPLTNNPFINGIGNDADFAQNLTSTSTFIKLITSFKTSHQLYKK